MDGQPSGLGWAPDGSLLVVSMTDHGLLRRAPDGAVTEVATYGEHCGGFANDMVVDAQGRAYIGNAGFDLMAGGEPSTANLVRVDLDGTVALAAEDLAFPNGSVITPDGSTLIVGETMGNRYTAFTIEDDGSLDPPPHLGRRCPVSCPRRLRSRRRGSHLVRRRLRQALRPGGGGRAPGRGDPGSRRPRRLRLHARRPRRHDPAPVLRPGLPRPRAQGRQRRPPRGHRGRGRPTRPALTYQ